jgi:hypothetical protein
LSPNEYGINYIHNNESLSRLVPGAPVSVLLTDIHSTGFLIKTYYHKYKIIYGFQSFEELIVRTSRAFSKKNAKNIGLSVFRRYRENDRENFTALPPGSIFIGDKNFGNWVLDNSGDKLWKFFRVYRQLPVYLGWNEFTPTFREFSKIKIHQEQEAVFYGLNKEFGTDGSISKKAFPNYFDRQKADQIDLKTFLKRYMKENFINRIKK